METKYEIGKLLFEAGKHYGQSTIKKYSIQLTNEFGKGYSTRSLKYMIKFYQFQKGQHFAAQLSWSHYLEITSLNNIEKINYYINISSKLNLSRDELREKIKSIEYERLPESTKNKLINKVRINIKKTIPQPILIKTDTDKVSEKILQSIIVQNITSFMKQLDDDYAFIDSEYKIKIGDKINYIDILLYNIKYNSYVEVEFKITELKKEFGSNTSIYELHI